MTDKVEHELNKFTDDEISVVGDYVLVRPDSTTRSNIDLIGKAADEERTSLIGQIVAVGTGEKVKGLKLYDRVQLIPSGLVPLILMNGERIFKAPIACIGVIYSEETYIDLKSKLAEVIAKEKVREEILH